MPIDPMHAARLALLEAALAALLRAHCDDYNPGDVVPDGIAVTMNTGGMSIDYLIGATPVAGEGL
jgi:hypothetical protein